MVCQCPMIKVIHIEYSIPLIFTEATARQLNSQNNHMLELWGRRGGGLIFFYMNLLMIPKKLATLPCIVKNSNVCYLVTVFRWGTALCVRSSSQPTSLQKGNTTASYRKYRVIRQKNIKWIFSCNFYSKINKIRWKSSLI